MLREPSHSGSREARMIRDVFSGDLSQYGKETKYLPQNTTAEQFMRSPFEPFDGLFQLKTIDIQAQLEDKASQIAGRKVNLRLGTELEFLFFADDFDPADSPDVTRDPRNVTPEQVEKVDRIIHDMALPSEEGGLGDMIYADLERIGRISIELRTIPSSVEQYTDQMKRVQQWIKTHCGDENLHPVVTSHHIHASLISEDQRVNVLQDRQALTAVVNGVTDMYHRALPLLRLPSEVERHLTEPARANDFRHSRCLIGAMEYGIIANRKEKHDGPPRIEGRFNSSEFAFDPYLDLMIQLIGMNRGLELYMNGRSDRDLDEDYPMERSMRNWRGEAHPYFDVFDYRWDAITQRLSDDFVLLTYLPKNVLDKMRGILQLFPHVADGQMSLTQLRAALAQQSDARETSTPAKADDESDTAVESVPLANLISEADERTSTRLHKLRQILRKHMPGFVLLFLRKTNKTAETTEKSSRQRHTTTDIAA